MPIWTNSLRFLRIILVWRAKAQALGRFRSLQQDRQPFPNTIWLREYFNYNKLCPYYDRLPGALTHLRHDHRFQVIAQQRFLGCPWKAQTPTNLE